MGDWVCLVNKANLHKITSLYHEILDHPVELASLVTNRQSILPATTLIQSTYNYYSKHDKYIANNYRVKTQEAYLYSPVQNCLHIEGKNGVKHILVIGFSECITTNK